MKELQKLQDSQDLDYLTNKVKVAVTVVYDRLESELSIDKLNRIVSDVVSEFGELNVNLIVTALRNGSLGKYGKTYKLNIQEICIWIREYLKTDEAHLLLTPIQKKQFPKDKPKPNFAI